MKFFYYIVLSCLFIYNAFTQDLSPGNNLGMYLDYARFRYDESKTYLEIYYCLGQTNLKMAELPPQDVKLKFKLINAESGAVLADEALNVALGSQQDAYGSSAAKIGLIKSVLPVGKYRLAMLRLGEKSDVVVDSILYEFATGPFSGERVTLSDLELCSNIVPRSPRKDALFYKNTMEVIPNPARIYGKYNPRIYYYIEIYNVKSPQPGQDLQIQIVIADQDGNIRASKRYKRNRIYESLVEKGAFAIRKFESGLYTLIFAVTDSVNNYSVYRRANFVVSNPDVVVLSEEDDQRLFMQSEYYSLPEAIVDIQFAQASYIATREEKKIYESLDNVEGKRKFLFKFWKKRTAKEPDIKAEYYARVEYANEHFKIPGREGWRTDRGRVYIIYGPPDNIERHPMRQNENPFEVWFYEELEGGSEFDFVDLSGFGDYQLVNSTFRNEIHDPNWKDYVYHR